MQTNWKALEGMRTWPDRVLSRRLPDGTEDVHDQPQEEALTAQVPTGLRLNTGVEYYRITLFVI